MKVANLDWRTPRCSSSRDSLNPSNKRLPAPRGAAASDHRTVGTHCLLQPGPVHAGRFPAPRRVVAPGPTEHPVVQALAAGPEPAARAITGPGDEAIHRDGDPSEHLAHRLSPSA